MSDIVDRLKQFIDHADNPGQTFNINQDEAKWIVGEIERRRAAEREADDERKVNK